MKNMYTLHSEGCTITYEMELIARIIKKLTRAGASTYYIIRNRLIYGACSPLRTVSVRLTKSTKIQGDVHVIAIKGAHIFLGEDVTLRSESFDYFGGMPFRAALLADAENATIKIGSGCRINGAYIHAKNKVSIGSNCVIAAGCNIVDFNGHQLVSRDKTNGQDNPRPISIGNNVWLCINSIILKGTTIGDHSVVAVNSVVKGDFPASCLIQGNPAKIVRYLPIPE